MFHLKCNIPNESPAVLNIFALDDMHIICGCVGVWMCVCFMYSSKWVSIPKIKHSI